MKASFIFLKYLFVFVLLPASLLAVAEKDNTITDSKTIVKTFTMNKDAEFKLISRESDVTITTWNENKVEVKVTLTVEAFEREELDKMLNEMQVSIIGSPESVSVQSDMCFKQQITTGSKTKIKTGTQTIKIKKYKFTYEIKMPRTNHLDLKNSYGSVTLGEHSGRVNLSIYEGSVMAGKMTPTEGLVSLKYSDATLGNVKDLKLEGYESKINIGESSQLNLNAKYCTVNAGKARDVQLSAYESKITLGVTTEVTGQQNYGTLTIAESKRISLKTYELNLQTGKVDNLTLTDSKYSKVVCGDIGILNITNAYENDMLFAKVGTIAGNAKYCKIDIGKLQESLSLTGYELTCRVDELSKDFKNLKVDGKYSKVYASMPSGTGYQLSSELTYGTISYPESNFVSTKNDKKDTRWVLEGKTKGYSGQSTISVKGFETDVTLTYR